MTRLAPDVHKRPVFAVDGVLARACDFRNRGNRLLAILQRRALVVCARRRIGSDDQKIFARIQTLAARARRKDCHIPCLEGESASFFSSELHATAAPRDAEDLVDARMIMDVAVDAVPPRASPAVAVKQLFKHGRGVERLRQPNRSFVVSAYNFPTPISA
jgi:hypothetical protein